MANQQLSTNTFGTAKWIVSATASDGTHTTIGAALTSASSGDTIFVRPGTYTENLTLKVGVNLTAYDCDSLTPNVTIVGKATLTTAGTVSISGIMLQTNSDFLIAVTGSAASILNLINCTLNVTNNTGITYTSSSSSARITLYRCTGNITTTGIAYFAASSAGTLQFEWCDLENPGISTTANTISSGTLFLTWSQILNPITTSSTAVYGATWSAVSGTNTTALTAGGSGTHQSAYCVYSSGTASAISVGNNLTSVNDRIASSNTNSITGGGTLTYSSISFIGASSKINTTTLASAPTDISGLSFDAGTTVLSTYKATTFTPAVAFGGSSTGITYTTQLGKYVQIGNLITFTIYIVLSSKGAQTGNASITGLPVTSANDGINYEFFMFFASGVSLATATYFLASLAPAATTLTLAQGLGATASSTALTNTGFSNTATIAINGSYFAT